MSDTRSPGWTPVQETFHSLVYKEPCDFEMVRMVPGCSLLRFTTQATGEHFRQHFDEVLPVGQQVRMCVVLAAHPAPVATSPRPLPALQAAATEALRSQQKPWASGGSDPGAHQPNGGTSHVPDPHHAADPHPLDACRACPLDCFQDSMSGRPQGNLDQNGVVYNVDGGEEAAQEGATERRSRLGALKMKAKGAQATESSKPPSDLPASDSSDAEVPAE